MVFCYNTDCIHNSEDTETVINGVNDEIEINYCTLEFITVAKTLRNRTDRRMENETSCRSYEKR